MGNADKRRKRNKKKHGRKAARIQQQVEANAKKAVVK